MRRRTLRSKLRKILGLEPARLTELYRLWRLKRYTPDTTNLLGFPLRFPDSRSFLYMHEEIFEKMIYEFSTTSVTPHIIDGGANIGLATIYFKRLLPHCRITAFEPDPVVRGYLENNIRAAQLDGVTVEPFALWSSQTELTFAAEGADGGRVLHDINDVSQVTIQTSVQTKRLRDYLATPVDLLKLDIEGAEGEVIRDCQDLLANVKFLFVEYHSFVGRPQSLGTILTILEKAGFKHHLSVPMHSERPFADRKVHLGMDNQLNIFAFR